MNRWTEADLKDALRRARNAQLAVDEYSRQARAGLPSNTQHMKNRDPHGRLLTLLIQDLKRHPRVAWLVRMNTGGFLSPDGKRRVRCGWKGQPDIIGQLRTGEFLGIEGKTGSGRPSAAQRATIATIVANGGCGFVARSVPDAWDQLDAFKRRASSS